MNRLWVIFLSGLQPRQGGQACRCTSWGAPWAAPWKSNTGVGLRVLGDLLCHHREMELAQKANKICGHLSLKPRPSLSGWWVFLFFPLFVCLLVWSGTLGYPAWCIKKEHRNGEHGGVDDEVRLGGGARWAVGWGGTSPRGDERPAEKLAGKAARQIHTDPRIRTTKTDRCLWSCSRGFLSGIHAAGLRGPRSTGTPTKTQGHKPLWGRDASPHSLNVPNTPATAVDYRAVWMLKCSLPQLHPGLFHSVQCNMTRLTRGERHLVAGNRFKNRINENTQA